MSESGPVLIIAEAFGARVRPVAYELVTAGRTVADGLGTTLSALVIGSDVAMSVNEFGQAGVDRLLVADDDRLAQFSTGAYTAIAAKVVGDLQPAAVLIAGTTAGRDYAPRLAARLRTGIAADCVDLSVEEGVVVAVRPVLGGRVQSAVKLCGRHPAIATVRPGSFEKAQSGSAAADPEPVPVELNADDMRVTVRDLVQEEVAAAKLDDAPVIVSGGRGLKEPDNFHLVEELATVLGAAVGASRAVVDAGWRPHHEQVGQTGRTVAPRLYVAVGISGAVQHLVGMQGADTIVAINRDPDAPIFKIASFGIVGDLFEVVPALIAELKAAKA
ncbi:MAG: electron transfer flavoprotein subunit alpha/FixB family protein [Thermomicrobiales bacterium]